MDKTAIEKFIEITGEGEASAIQYLTLAEGNVENAITLLFESGGVPLDAAPPPEEPEVRPPILPTREVLVPSEPVCSFPRASSNVFDRFRDFSVEIRRQEEEMTRKVIGSNRAVHSKTKRLEDLFRPPYEILFMGSFVEAREQAKTMNRWLLVNVQNPQEFSCQILNRDVWPDNQIKEIVKDHFILWQVLSNSSDGKRYIDFYNVTEYPYLAIVDPRTGECVKSYTSITVDGLLTSLNDMLSTYPSPECSTSSPKVEESHCEPSSSIKRSSRADSMTKDSGRRIKKSKNADIPTSSAASSSRTGLPSSSTAIRGKRSRIEIAEEIPEMSQTDEAAVVIEESSTNKNLPESSTKAAEVPVENGEPSLRLCLRLPSGGREAVSMCANDTIEGFIKRMESMGYSSSDHTYLIPFPKTNLGALPSQTRLSDTILYPSNTVFITKV
ncbi:UBX domain-containing protein 7 [Fopius arisanus]|uniref:UBX domain-containing protein 7 n=1 Tax=Fopius arisanus TaxID=64838 RepID=A0A9R1U4W2_9HYME|nr:PREDICTED: UBX domain-containing protein 7 [Fopius arisanus]